jgi:hypothetical protein
VTEGRVSCQYTPLTVLFQQKVEEVFQGRIFGVLSMISSSMMPLVMLVFWPLDDIMKIEWTLKRAFVIFKAKGNVIWIKIYFII